MDTRSRLIGLLDDGQMHSGEELAQTLGCSRTAVWKHVRSLQMMGVNVSVRRGRGYRLTAKLERFAESAVRAVLRPETASAMGQMMILDIANSTSEQLISKGPPQPGQFDVCLAEFQTGGRGRRGRKWFSPYAGGICMSFSWQFQTTPADLPALGLVAGLAVRDTLTEAGVEGIALKWPNDVMLGTGKAAGILIDVSGDSSGPLEVVIGMGINLDNPPDLQAAVSESGGIPSAGMREAADTVMPSRSELAGELVNSLHSALVRFQDQGFMEFADSWRRCDYLAGRQIKVLAGQNQWQGVAAGISDSGALRLDTAGGTRELVSGEVTVRPAAS